MIKTSADVSSVKWFNQREQLEGDDFGFKKTVVNKTAQHTLIFNEVYPDDAGLVQKPLELSQFFLTKGGHLTKALTEW